MRIYDGRFDKKSYPTKRTVSVISAGVVSAENNDYMTIRKNGREDWSLFFCEKGYISFENSVLQENEVWIYPPQTPQKYTIYKKDKTVYRYLHFTGSDLKNLLHTLGIELQNPIKINSSLVTHIFESVIKCLQNGTLKDELCAEYHVLHLFSKLVSRDDTLEDSLLNRVIDDMEHRYHQKYDAFYYADMLKLSVSRFNHVFKERIGVAPYTYYCNLRIANAKSLLEETNFKIKEISEKCGYENEVYFTQAFKKSVGLTPSQYRTKTVK